MTLRILGVETSCDETAAAVVADGREILSSVVASQVDVHRNYGGVVPELASREHLRQIVPVVREALHRAGMTLQDVDAIAVTYGPGLIGALLVGLTYGKTLALSLGKPLVGVNHLEGHVYAVFLEAYKQGREPALPAVCLIVSGGHTVLYAVSVPATGVASSAQSFHYRHISQTRDDAAGEAYDKVARLLALGYPGGPIIDQLATSSPSSNGRSVQFAPARMKGNALDFSFSGIKTAVLYHLRAHPELLPEIQARRDALARGERKADQLLPLCSTHTLNILREFQDTVVKTLTDNTMIAAQQSQAVSVLVSGGVAANSALRTVFHSKALAHGLDVFFPSRELSTDNAAMIAAAAYRKLVAGDLANVALDAEATLPLTKR
ncbi:MAG TPA: tRNA (adenosine(37)-N6)-threonylcarbamoyltransferase complex transferase subunit TsaD [Candidatus Dormibacteraeota bacterium]|nr:tRNA (adenosine(37)-N6)-threonylcarbamoyltransferase complex transferase subunit TsaD [Candidatus Dormibacteraeota bacterium]